MKNRLQPLLLSMVLASTMPIAYAQQAPEPDAPPAAAFQPSEWQKRRQRFLDTAQALAKGNEGARQDFIATASVFEADPFQFTPLEAMDLIGMVLLPQLDIERVLPLVSAMAALGLYDMYRFATPLGQAELLNGERFLWRPLGLGGPDVTAKARAFLRDRPLEAGDLIRQGLRIAAAERHRQRYPIRWPADLGRCASPTPGVCPSPVEVSDREWGELWGRAVAQVVSYYRVEENKPSNAEAKQ